MISGKTDPSVIIAGGVAALALAGAVTDLVWGRIFNWLNLAGMLAGIVVGGILGGWPAVGSSLLGVLAGFLLYGWLFWSGAMGGGDLKFLMALGAWGGGAFAIETGLLGVLVGGALSLAMIVARGRLRDFAGRLYFSVLTLFVEGMQPEAPKLDRASTLPFGVPLAAAAIWAVLAHPLARWKGGLP